jgi:WhiB family redox-sensing transcriptional regulator
MAKRITFTEDVSYPERPEWHGRGACRGRGNLFFDDKKKSNVAKAKALCAICVVKEVCLTYAMENDDFGVWGGLTLNERRVARRKAKKERMRLAK